MIYNGESACRDLADYIHRLEAEKERLLQKLIAYNKDKHIKQLLDRIDELQSHSLVTLTDTEIQNEDAFMEEHSKTCGDGKMVPYWYKLTPTGIGIKIEMRCGICGEERNITDYECW